MLWLIALDDEACRQKYFLLRFNITGFIGSKLYAWRLKMADWCPAMPLSGRTAHRGGTSFSFRHPSDTRGSTSLSIGLFNVRGLSLGTKKDQLVSDMSHHQETKCADGFDEILGGFRLLGLPSQSRPYGLGFAVTNWLAKRVTRFWSVSD